MTIISNQVDVLRGVQDCVGRLRRELARDSLEMFVQAYLPAHFRLPPSPMHVELFEMLQNASHRRNARIAVAAPRGHAKSTVVSLGYVLWCVCYQREAHIVIISNTADQAVDLLAAVKSELESNPRLIADFPEAAEPPGVKPGPKRWRKTDIITRNDIKIIALGAGQKIRGRKHHQHRPSLIILDDIENETEVDSADQREAKMTWFKKAVLKAGATAHTNVVVVGTLLHYDALLTQLIEGRTMPGWDSRKYQAVLSWAQREDLWQQWAQIYTHQAEYQAQSGPDVARRSYDDHEDTMLEGTQVLWPERENYYQLMELRLCDGHASFDSEKQNEPVDPASCFFNLDSMHYWDDEYDSEEDFVAHLGHDIRLWGACDPSLGIAGKNRDDTAIITIVQHRPTGHLYVLDADIGKRKPQNIINTIISYHRIRRYHRFGVESNQFQEFLADQLQQTSRQANVHVPVKKIKHTSDKFGRIQSLEPLITMGTLRFSRRHRVLLDQLRQFPKAAHDDGPDALQMAVELTRQSHAVVVHAI